METVPITRGGFVFYSREQTNDCCEREETENNF